MHLAGIPNYSNAILTMPVLVMLLACNSDIWCRLSLPHNADSANAHAHVDESHPGRAPRYLSVADMIGFDASLARAVPRVIGVPRRH